MQGAYRVQSGHIVVNLALAKSLIIQRGLFKANVVQSLPTAVQDLLNCLFYLQCPKPDNHL